MTSSTRDDSVLTPARPAPVRAAATPDRTVADAVGRLDVGRLRDDYTRQGSFLYLDAFLPPDAHAKLADAARTLFDDVKHHWQTTGAGGTALYAYAERRATELGWRLNLDIKGHRVSDFPHAIYKAGDLGDFDAYPDAGLWILEIQLAHPTRPFGAFYEDLLA